MHHPKEAVIDGVKFVLVREELISQIFSVFVDFLEGHHISRPILEDLKKKLEEV